MAFSMIEQERAKTLIFEQLKLAIVSGDTGAWTFRADPDPASGTVAINVEIRLKNGSASVRLVVDTDTVSY